MNGASRPTSTMSPSTMRAMREDLPRRRRRTVSASGDSRGRAGLASANSWVCPGIEQIGEKTSNCHHDAAEDHSTDDEGVVAGSDCGDDRESHSGPHKYLLDEEGAGEESGEGESKQADDWKQCVAQRMAAEYLALGQPFQPRGPDVV